MITCDTCGSSCEDDTKFRELAGRKACPACCNNPNIKPPAHLNSSVVCVIDCETTGLNPSVHDIWSLTIIALDNHFRPDPRFLPFDILIKPARPENYDRHNKFLDHAGIQKATLEGFDFTRAVDLFERWYDQLQLKDSKNIVPLGHNYTFDKGFLQQLFGPLNYDYYFHYHYRDSMVTALYINDRFNMTSMKVSGQSYPYPKVNLKYLATTLGVPLEHAHTSMDDAICTAECYRRLIMLW
jgi:DNA polymerase III epsilon subunit-like protein